LLPPNVGPPMRRRRWWWAAGGITLLVIAGVLLARFADEPMRRRVEAQVNAALDGYKVKIGRLDLQPIGLAVDLADVVVIQQKHPEPPIAYLPRLRASLQWGAILHRRLVSDFKFERPRFWIDTRHAQVEAADKKRLDERGWQEAALAIFPFKVNLLRIDGGEVTYLEKGPLGLVYLWDLDFGAENIRNVRSKDREYPSRLHLKANMQQSAKIRLDGRADFLAVPHPGIKAALDVQGVELASLEPIVQHYDMSLRSGKLALAGNMEYAPKVKKVELANVTVDGADVAYVTRREGQPTVSEKAAQTAADVMKEPEVIVVADEVKIDRSRLAYRNETTSPAYQLFVGDMTLTVKHFTNVKTSNANANGTGTADVAGKFMDSGVTKGHVDFRPKPNGTDFDLRLAIESTDVTTMNDLWRAYGKFELKRGSFSLYSELGVKDGNVDGYIKPIFKDLDVSDVTASNKGVGQKLYEGIVGGVANVLKNQPHDQVATETSLSGPLESPHTSVLQVAGNLVRNAFFKAILPGLERSRRGDGK
jgi:hypothetical protein